MQVVNGLLMPRLFAAEELWVVCGNETAYTWEFVGEGNGPLPSGCVPAAIQVYTRI